MLYIKGRNDGKLRRVEHIPRDMKRRKTRVEGGDYARVLIHDEQGTRTQTVHLGRIQEVQL